MSGAITDWNALHKQAYDNLSPGGWFEMQEYEGWMFSDDDPDLNKIPNLKSYVELINEGSRKFGKDVDMAPKQRKLMEEAGFVDVREKIAKVGACRVSKSKRPNLISLT